MLVATGGRLDKQYRRAWEWNWSRSPVLYSEAPPVPTYDLSSILMPSYLRRQRRVQQPDQPQNLLNTLLGEVAADPFKPVVIENPFRRPRARQTDQPQNLLSTLAVEPFKPLTPPNPLREQGKLPDFPMQVQDFLLTSPPPPDGKPALDYTRPRRRVQQPEPAPSPNTLLLITVEEMPAGRGQPALFIVRRRVVTPPFQAENILNDLLSGVGLPPGVQEYPDRFWKYLRSLVEGSQSSKLYVLTSAPQPDGSQVLEVPVRRRLRFVPYTIPNNTVLQEFGTIPVPEPVESRGNIRYFMSVQNFQPQNLISPSRPVNFRPRGGMVNLKGTSREQPSGGTISFPPEPEPPVGGAFSSGFSAGHEI